MMRFEVLARKPYATLASFRHGMPTPRRCLQAAARTSAASVLSARRLLEWLIFYTKGRLGREDSDAARRRAFAGICPRPWRSDQESLGGRRRRPGFFGR